MRRTFRRRKVKKAAKLASFYAGSGQFRWQSLVNPMAICKIAMPAKKSSALTARTLKARVSDAPLLKKLDALKAQYGLNESSLLREALRDYVGRERMRDEIAAMDQRFGATLDKLINLKNFFANVIRVI